MDKTNLNNGHWQAEDYTQRMTNAEWQNILLGSREGKNQRTEITRILGLISGDK